MDRSAPQVLIVDDEPINRDVLASPLEAQGFSVVHAGTATEALIRFAEAEAAGGLDVVLLDIQLPDGNGFEVMKAMRLATPADERIPVILVTASGGREDRRRGLEDGADDFLGKPVDPHELVCRVRTFVALRAAQRVLRERARQLEELQQARAELARLLVHDLKNPLAGIVTNLEFLWRAAQRKKVDASSDQMQSLEDARDAGRRLLGLVEGLVHVEQAETGQLVAHPARVRVRALLEDVSRQFTRNAADHGISIAIDGEEALEATLDRGLVARALENLVANAIRFATGGRVELCCRAEGESILVSVANTGPTIPGHQRDVLFQKFRSRAAGSASAGPHLGVGLYLCRLVAEAHGGSIALVEDPPWSARFQLRLPA